MATFEYQALGMGGVEVDGQSLSLAEAVQHGHAARITAILNTLGAQGWELLALEPPFVFKRLKSND